MLLSSALKKLRWTNLDQCDCCSQLGTHVPYSAKLPWGYYHGITCGVWQLVRRMCTCRAAQLASCFVQVAVQRCMRPRPCRDGECIPACSTSSGIRWCLKSNQVDRWLRDVIFALQDENAVPCYQHQPPLHCLYPSPQSFSGTAWLGVSPFPPQTWRPSLGLHKSYPQGLCDQDR